MALTAQAVLTRAGDTLQDVTNVRWPVDELLRYLNDARREIAIVRPDIYAVVTPVVLAAGTKQALPADGSRFIDAVRVINAGDTPGRAVRIVERELLDAQRPDWHAEAPAATKHFMFDERSPKVFFVYPPAAAGAKLEVVYSRSPQEILVADVASTELVDEEDYAGAIASYVCYRAFLKDAEYAGNAQRAQSHYVQFSNALGLGVRASFVSSPNTANVGGQPPRAAAAVG